MFGIGAAEMMIVVAMFAGSLGLPFGVPPLPPDQTIQSAAPPQCLFYVRSAGTAAPNAKSTNHTEQLLAEEEVSQFINEVGEQIDSVLKQLASKDPKAEQSRQFVMPFVKLLATRPAAVYLETLVPPQNFGPPDVKAGMIVNCGPEKAAIAKIIKQIEDVSLTEFPQSKITDVTVEKVALRRFQPTGGPEFVWGFKDNYFLMTVGDSAAAGMLKRIGKPGSPPRWLAAAEGLAGKSRISSLGYVNLGGILDFIRGQVPDPKFADVIDALGLGGVKALSSITGFDEQGTFNKTLIGVEGQPEGLFELVSDDPLTAADLKGIPRNATYAVAARLDLAAIYHEAIARIGKVEPQAAAQASAAADGLEQELGFHIDRDLIQSLGDVWTLHSAAADAAGGWTGLVLTVTARDKEKLAEVQDKLVEFVQQAAGPQAPFTIRETMIGNVKVRQVMPKGPVPVSPAWCVTDKHLVVAATLQTLKAHLARGAKSPSLAELPAVAKELKTGAAIITFEDTKSSLRGIYGAVQTYGPILTGLASQQGVDFNLPTLPSFEVIEKHILPGVGAVRRTKAGIFHESHQSVPLGGGAQIAAAPVLIGLLLPAVQAAREAARRTQANNNLKQIVIAMHNHHDINKSLPGPAIVDKKGKPLLSWRVQLLPYLEGDALYKEFHLDEPWDSEHNKKLIAKMPAVYGNPSSPAAAQGKTAYLLPTGKGTMYDGDTGPSFKDITDGTSNTIMIVEAADDAAVEWTRPADLEFDPEKPLAGLEHARPGGFQAAFADGSVHFIINSIDLEVLKALFTPDGKEDVKLPE